LVRPYFVSLADPAIVGNDGCELIRNQKCHGENDWLGLVSYLRNETLSLPQSDMLSGVAWP
jgi:hypothetical protein